jgi:hypothetical protein
MSTAIEQRPTIYLDVQNLRAEYGWPEVARGLNKILMGYVYYILGIIAIAGVLGFIIAKLATNPKDTSVCLLFEIAVMVSFGVMILLSLYCYGMIVLGSWRCLKHVPERYGAKWMMFTCMIGMAMGPALNTACSLGGVRKQPELRQGPKGFKMPEFDQSTRYMQVASISLSLVSWALFMCFLRAVALCFNDTACAMHVVLWLVFFGLLVGATAFLAFANPRMLLNPLILLGLGLGLIVAFLWHLVLIFLVRLSLTYRLDLIRSPLEM